MMDCGLKKYIYKKNSIALFCSLVFLGGLILFFFFFFQSKNDNAAIGKICHLSLSLIINSNERL